MGRAQVMWNRVACIDQSVEIEMRLENMKDIKLKDNVEIARLGSMIINSSKVDLGLNIAICH